MKSFRQFIAEVDKAKLAAHNAMLAKHGIEPRTERQQRMMDTGMFDTKIAPPSQAQAPEEHPDGKKLGRTGKFVRGAEKVAGALGVRPAKTTKVPKEPESFAKRALRFALHATLKSSR